MTGARRAYRIPVLNAFRPVHRAAPRLLTLPNVLFAAFLVWTAVGFVVMPLGVGEPEIRAWLGVRAVQDAALALLRVSDAVWIMLAAACVYFHAATAEGLNTARLWAVIILVSSTIFEWIGTRTGFPFGPYRYTDNFGWRLGGVVPLAIPLAWLVVLLCSRYLVLALRPAATRLEIALWVAVLAVLTDLNLEHVAWRVRAYWVWYPGWQGTMPTWPPVQNYVSWFVLSFGLACVLPPNYALRSHRPSSWRPITVLALMNALLAFVHLVRWLQHLRHQHTL